MKFERLITIITNLAVVSGMVLVVFELQQNREAIQIAHQFFLAGLMSQTHLAVATDHELADLITRAKRNDTQDFSPADIERVNRWALAILEPRISSYHLRSNEFVVLEDKISLEQWFIALVAAIIGGICGHVFTLKLYRERAISIENGLFHEVELVKEYYESWLAHLIDEYRNPVRESFSGIEGYDTGCLESLVVELISAGKILSKDRRRLILNLKKTLAGVAKEDRLRNKHAKYNEEKSAFIVPTPSTARLIGSAVEIIYYTRKFVHEKDTFSFLDDTQNVRKAEIAFESAGIVFNREEWGRISEHHLESA